MKNNIILRDKLSINPLQIIERIPEESRNNPNTIYLDPDLAGGQLISSLIEDQRARGFSDENIKSRIFAFSSDILGLNYAVNKRNLIGNFIVSDFLSLEVETNLIKFTIGNKAYSMNFGVILTNPPYTLGKNKSFYKKFIEKSLEILQENGTMVMVTPHTWIENKDGKSSSLFQDMCKEGYFSSITQKDGDKEFEIGLGTPVSYFTYSKGGEKRGTEEISRVKEKNTAEEEIIKKIMGSPLLPKGGQMNQGRDKKGELKDYSPELTDTHIYPVYLSSGEERSQVYSDVVPKGFGITKLTVSSILMPLRSERFSEISTNKGVGRYSKYFSLEENKAKNAQKFFNTQSYKFIDSIKRNGRYAYLALPDLDFSREWKDEEIWRERNLSLDEIEIIKNS